MFRRKWGRDSSSYDVSDTLKTLGLALSQCTDVDSIYRSVLSLFQTPLSIHPVYLFFRDGPDMYRLYHPFPTPSAPPLHIASATIDPLFQSTTVPVHSIDAFRPAFPDGLYGDCRWVLILQHLGDTLGFILLGDLPDHRAFNEADFRLFAQMGDRIGTTLALVKQNEDVANDLRQRNRELEQLNQGLEGRIHDQIDAIRSKHDELKREAHAAQSANALKSEFLETVGKDFREPLQALTEINTRLQLENADQTALLGDELQLIASCAAQLHSSLDDISRMPANTEPLDVQLEPLSFRILERELHLQMSALLNRKDVEFELHRDASVPDVILTDPRRLRQILTNLLSNAAKFTDMGFIRLMIRLANPNRLWCRVKDSGVGIERKEQQRIFDFFRTSSSISGSYIKGSGLGLSIVKQNVTLLDGEIRVRSTPGHGSTFDIEIPFQHVIVGADDAGN